ncbi:VWA domain-containing protein [Endozoicomonas sp. SM1973]|uniref:VWA domain-containing protein n=1 Tax=Spartinivicinus marinus TaxID=2994442 RepID=A0A853HZU4_9GAMM|nr:VWA domain-containing protein [Spartinivicinus marinus]MCX4029213.1 VWA domain-containing protein [Spartinivicinus marinus]NYZ65879.1 VWA domain-containing protein [Spartinivicinus marinus]
MLIQFFEAIRAEKIPVTIREWLDLLAALEKQVVFADIDQFYYLARTCLIKDERYYDRFDQAFAHYFNGLDDLTKALETLIPDEWLRKAFERHLSEEEKRQIQSLGGLEKLLETFKKRLEEQQERHQGGNRWIGTGGTSPFGAFGYNPEGIRIGQPGSRHRRAVKVWDQRQFKNLDGEVELGTRNIKMALRRLRQFARQGAAEELALNDTIRATAEKGGLLDIKMVPERHNTVKVLLLMDIGGTMDDYVQQCEELFAAAKSEFKHLEFFYFHNFIYEAVWQDNLRRHDDRLSSWELLRTYGADYKVIFVGDAAMSPYEIAMPGGSVEHWNEEAGSTWMERFKDKFTHIAWLNPLPESSWGYYQSCQMIQEQLENNMFPMTIDGLERAMQHLVK